MKTFTLLILTMIIMATTICGQTIPTIETGVSQTLAKWRAANYSDVRYKLNITLEKGAPLMRGEIEIRVTLTDEGAKNDLILDWRTTQFATDKDKPFADVVSVNQTVMGKATQSSTYDYQTTKEHLLISHRFFKTGENTIKINFASPIKTSGAAITRYVDKEDGAEYIYSLFVPSDASMAFPVFDQPDLKARFKLNIRSYSFNKFVSNTKEKIIAGYTAASLVGGFPHNFEETQPISTYVFAFAAGDFAEFKEEEFNNAESDVIRDPIIKQSDIDALPYKSGKPKATNNKSKDKSTNYVNKNSTAKSDATSNSKVFTSKIYVRKSQAEKFKQHAAEVFRLNREGIKFLESWFDYKFPFPKYDLVLIPEFPFGGMEHAGATFLREDRVIFPTEPTKNDLVTRANVIFHEAAHQWFGDTVTMRWFDDLWLKEGFAEFMAYKTMEKVLPEYNAWKIFYERNKQAAYLTDSTRGTTPIYQEIPNLSAAKSAYGNIVYRKAPSYLRQAEFYLGEDKFQTAIRAFLKKHEFSNATWQDLVKEFEIAPGGNANVSKKLDSWAQGWVTKPGLSIVHTFTGADAPGFKGDEQISDDLQFVQYQTSQSNQTADSSMPFALKFKLLTIFEDGSKEIRTTNITPSSSMNTEYLHVKSKVKFAFPNYQDYGYGIFLLDERSRAYVLANIQTEKDDFLRTMMWGALWDSVREGELNPKDYVELVIKNISIESDESTIQTILGRVSTAMNYYLSDAQVKELAPRVENVLLNRMSKAETAGQRITFYRAFLNAASTDTAKKILKDILENNGKISLAVDVETKTEIDAVRLIPISLPLKTKDRFDIVTRLLILNNKDAPNLLAALEKSETSDEAKRYAYAAHAGIATQENAAKFWNDFTNNKELSENYIESAFVPFNSPRHADLTLPYLEKALTELPNLKRNRKIFFINGWLGAFIGGQKSEQALQIVNKFLADNPNLDKDLRLKILENVDGLERAVKIRNKFNN